MLNCKYGISYSSFIEYITNTAPLENSVDFFTMHNNRNNDVDDGNNDDNGDDGDGDDGDGDVHDDVYELISSQSVAHPMFAMMLHYSLYLQN